MKIALLIAMCAAALAAGVFAAHGGFSSGSLDRWSGTNLASKSALVDSQPLRTTELRASDARISRVFTALGQPVAMRRRFELVEAMNALTAADMPALMKGVEALPKATRDELFEMVVEKWFKLDPDVAHAWAGSNPDNWTALNAWARARPEAAIQEALAATNRGTAATLLDGAIEQLTGGDLAARVARIEALPPGPVRNQSLLYAIGKWAESNPAAAFAALAKLPPGKDRENARRLVLYRWASGPDVAGALAQMDAILPTLKAGLEGDSLVNQIARGAAKDHPALILDWLAKIPLEFRVTPAISAARALATTDPQAALAWCLANGIDINLGEEHRFSGVSPGVLGGAMIKAPDATLAWLEALPEGNDRDRYLERAMKDGLWQLPGDKLFKGDGAVAMRLFNELSPDAQARSADALGRARGKMSDLTDLNAWVQPFAPGSIRADAIAGAIGAAFQQDASRVDALLSSVSTDADRDAALRGLAETMSNSVPSDAAARALAIGDSALRRETLDTVIPLWLKRDPEACNRWIQSATAVPADWKEAWQP